MKLLDQLLEIASGKRILIAMFLFCSLPTGVLSALLTPPGQVPDEPAHMARAESLLRGQIIGHRQIVFDSTAGKSIMTAGVDVNYSLLSASFGQVTEDGDHRVVTGVDYAEVAGIRRGTAIAFSMTPNTVRSFPAFYLPAAEGLEIGWTTRMSPYRCFLLARMAMLISFLVMGSASLWLASFGESVLLGVLLLPMSLFLGGSLNLDGQLIGASCLAGALLTRNSFVSSSRLPAAVILTMIACAKPPYILLLTCLLMPLSMRKLGERGLLTLLAVMPVVMWSATIAKTVLVPMSVGPYHPGPLWPGNRLTILNVANPAGNFHILATHPARFVNLPLHSLWILGHQNIHEAIGVLGDLSIVLPHPLYFLWECALLLALPAAFVESWPDAIRWHWTDAIFMTIVLAATVFAIELSTYLSWTNLGDIIINGVTGRYFLPLLPFIPMVLPRLKMMPRFIWLKLAGTVPVLMLGVFDTVYLPFDLVNHYYVH